LWFQDEDTQDTQDAKEEAKPAQKVT